MSITIGVLKSCFSFFFLAALQHKFLIHPSLSNGIWLIVKTYHVSTIRKAGVLLFFFLCKQHFPCFAFSVEWILLCCFSKSKQSSYTLQFYYPSVGNFSVSVNPLSSEQLCLFLSFIFCIAFLLPLSCTLCASLYKHPLTVDYES